MAGLKHIDYKGIGGGLSITASEDSLPSKSTIGLSGNSQTSALHGLPQCATRSDAASRVASILNTDLLIKSSGRSSGFTTQNIQPTVSPTEQYSQQDLTPLERYRYQAQAHEQVALGQTPDRQPFLGFNKLDGLPYIAAETLAGATHQYSESSRSVFSSSVDESPGTISASELDNLLRLKNSPEWQFKTEEERYHDLRKITKLRRHLKAREGSREKRPVRVRKRSKTSTQSTEVAEA